ncbi:hypothetical protein [Rhizorhapis suberifaciens]|uniref:Uncharacterized protein n=1 Tax=Rhizorhapis suberifaciens TaxID=13656 RepID=A0A840HYB1_9SPHN|nr:hypothetical protein [Rhizorhapis suberifaciens]MBB4642374.1 hypothetical protein [Rhizorhapis suberifaciens]
MAQDWFDSIPSTQAPASRQGRLVRDPYKAREEERKDSSESRAEAAERRAEEAAARAAAETERANRAESRLDEKAVRERQAAEARGGIETTEAERTAGFLATRVAGGLRDLAAIGNAGSPTLQDAAIGGTLLGNYATDEARQRTINAQRDILDAALTLGTGAAYTTEQIDSYRKSYFPQPGDEPGTVKDKTRRLQTMMEAARIKAGAASGLIDDALTQSNLFGEPPAEGGNPLSVDQQRLYDAFMAANPSATADQLRTFATTAGLPSLENAEEIVSARQTGGQFSPASTAVRGSQPYTESYVSQGLSGVNEGIANTLGAPVDLVTSALNLVPQGINALANTDLGQITEPVLGSGWWQNILTDAGTIAPETDDAGKQFIRRVGESVGGSAIPIAGTATTIPRSIAGLLVAGGGGAGAATANQVFPDNPIAEMGGEIVGSGLAGAGLFGAATRNARRAAEAAVPSRADLRQQATDLYQDAESRGIVAGPNVTGSLAGRVQDIARNNALVTPTGRVSGDYPRAAEAMRLLDDYSGRDITPKDIQVVRDTLADAVGATEGKERRIAKLMLQAFDEETIPLAPELASARKTASKYLSAEQIGKSIDLADPRSAQYSQSGASNALKTEFRKLDRDIIKGEERFNPAVVQAIQNVSRGTPATKAAEWVGRFAPRTTGGMFLSGAPGAAFLAGGDPVTGALLSGGIGGAGLAGRAIADRAVQRNSQIAEMLARNGGALNVPTVIDSDVTRQIIAQLSASTAPYTQER